MRRDIYPEFSKKCSGQSCHGCGHKGLVPILDYGPMPISDGFQNQPGRLEGTGRVPLELAFCTSCSLLQVLEIVDPATLFGENYLYLSSLSESWLSHCRKNAKNLVQRYNLDENCLVLETASNDGYLLQFFQEHGVMVQGIDPASAPVSRALARGIPTIEAFFTHRLASELSREGRADLVISNNVVAHVANIHDFIDGVREILKPEGTWVIEVPYVGDLLEGCAFDTVYHEHLCYFSVTSLQALLKKHKLHINHLQRLSSHGGSLRIFASQKPGQSRPVDNMLNDEECAGLTEPGCYQDFAKRALNLVETISGLLEDSIDSGRKLAAYGAAAKGTILLNCLGNAAKLIEFVIDRNLLKQGKWVPGVDLPIISPEEGLRQKPDDLLLLPWNLRREILSQQEDFLEAGGRIIVPLPVPEIVSGALR